MKDSEKIMQQGARIQNRISSNDKKPRSFGTSQLLHQSEIHFIDAIGPGEGMNASYLSRKMGITNGAVTQTADKLRRKHLIEKYKREGNKKEVYLRLTDEGTTAFEEHRLFHKEINDKMTAYLDGLNDDQKKGIIGLMELIEQNLPDLAGEDGS